MKKVKLLLVDDDELSLATFGMGLRRSGYEVALAGSGAEAVETAAGSAFDLAILDKRMPEMSGCDVGRILMTHRIPFIILSAYGEADSVDEAVEIGALGYLLKPIDVDRAIPTIQTAVQRGRELFAFCQVEDRLTNAIETGKVVDVVVGVLMERHRISQPRAFELLRSKARAERRKVRETALQLLDAWYCFNEISSPGSTVKAEAGQQRQS